MTNEEFKKTLRDTANKLRGSAAAEYNCPAQRLVVMKLLSNMFAMSGQLFSKIPVRHIWMIREDRGHLCETTRRYFAFVSLALCVVESGSGLNSADTFRCAFYPSLRAA